MVQKKSTPQLYDDYIQSANTLFHFMSKIDYLHSILAKRVIVPRYCMEDIEYLNLHRNGIKIKEVAILQKCFCDIPFHKLTERYELNGTGENFNLLTDEKKHEFRNNNTHPDFYGKFAIAFSKAWGEKNKLQPVHYLNPNSSYTTEFSNLFDRILNLDDVPDEYVDDILSRLSFFKPLRGIMKRKLETKDSSNKDIEFYKNFHDEKEWRYVPDIKQLEKSKLNKVIANPTILNFYSDRTQINKRLESEEYKSLWLNFDYDEIKYIIVPDSSSRIDMIKTIMDIPSDRFIEQGDIKTQKHILLSKILVLEEIRKDW